MTIRLTTRLSDRLARSGAVLARGARDRGATGVEYALILGLVVVVSIGAIEALQSNAEARFESSSADAGTPVESNGLWAERAPAPTGGGPGVTAPPSGDELDASISLGGGIATPGKGQRWNATVTVTATDQFGAPMPGVLIVLGWSGDKAGNAQLWTELDGSVSHTVESIHQHATLTFTVVDAYAEGYIFVQPYPSLSLNKDSD
jgi:Flp pilus assembly pilin Flp